MKIFLDVVGCRLNQSEVEGFANQFRALGHEIVSAAAEADIAIVNTCTVTVKAAADSRKKLRRAAREGIPMVVATGCWASLEPKAARNLPGLTHVFVNADKDALVASLLNKTHEEVASLAYHRVPLPGERARTRAFIKVQEGCDNNCTYCLTRVARGRSRSRSLSQIGKDIRAAMDGGAVEIVLTGVQLGAWGRDFSNPLRLKDLIKAILGLPGINRVRLSSIEPWEFDLSMLSLWQDERLCRHLHIPLQSGSDPILKKMGRPITLSAYQALLEHIRHLIPDIAITTDVITGFPGETEADFEVTKAFINQVNYAGGHVFTYSPRPGTAAYKMEGSVPPPVAKVRNKTLRKIFANTGQQFRERFIGNTMVVLWESCVQNEDGLWQLSGLTDNYIRVISHADTNLWNQISAVKLTAHAPGRNALNGHIVGGVTHRN
ncbi:MAG: MiaB/RimO family radical SAM methylthiotransferase [Chloroflexi bacterium]|nr:MiaB/RimO family radical SAM methylthiotransferase [Chloroflexota bacterium]